MERERSSQRERQRENKRQREIEKEVDGERGRERRKREEEETWREYRQGFEYTRFLRFTLVGESRQCTCVDKQVFRPAFACVEVHRPRNNRVHTIREYIENCCHPFFFFPHQSLSRLSRSSRTVHPASDERTLWLSPRIITIHLFAGTLAPPLLAPSTPARSCDASLDLGPRKILKNILTQVRWFASSPEWQPSELFFVCKAVGSAHTTSCR